MTAKVRDVIAAEQVLEGAETELLRYERDPSKWSAYESMDPQGKRALNITPLHYERIEALQGRVEDARQALRSVKRDFLADVITEGGAGRATP